MTSLNQVHDLTNVQQQTTAGEAQIEASEAGVGSQVQHNVELAHDAAEHAASSAKMHGSKLTGEANTAAGKFQKEVTAKTNDAVAEGQHDVEAAKAAGAGYVEQAMEMAGNVLATAQTYLPPSLGGTAQTSATEQSKSVVNSASTTATNMAASVQAGASTIVDAAKDFLASSNTVSIQDSAQPHINKARELAGRVIEGSGAGPDVAPPASSTGIPATSAPLESGPHTMSTPYPSTTTTVGSGVKIAENEKKDV